MDRRSNAIAYIEDVKSLSEGQVTLRKTIEEYNSVRPKSMHINPQAMDIRDAHRLFTFIEAGVKDALRIDRLKDTKAAYVQSGKALIEMGYPAPNAGNLIREINSMSNNPLENASDDDLLETLRKRLENKGPAETQAIINTLRGNTVESAIESDPNNTDADSNDYLINRSSWLKAVNDNDDEIVMNIQLSDSTVSISMFTGQDLELLDNESASMTLEFEPKNDVSPH